MKRIKLKAVGKHERRMAHQRRSRKSNGAEILHALHTSKAQHPSATRSIHRENASMEAIHD